MSTPPYDSLYQVMYSAMMRLNDEIETLQLIGGQILDNPAAFTQQGCNNAWRWLLDQLRNLGYQGLIAEAILSSAAATSSINPSTQVFIDWTGYNNGSALQSGLALPAEAICPLSIWERISQVGGPFLEMDQELNGLPMVTKGTWNRKWEWRGEKIYMPGSTVVEDFRVRYERTLADFADDSPLAATPWYGQPVPIVNVLNAFAWAICAEFSSAREDLAPQSQAFADLAMDAAQLVFNRDVRRPTAIYKASEMSKMRDARTAPLPNGRPPAQVAP